MLMLRHLSHSFVYPLFSNLLIFFLSSIYPFFFFFFQAEDGIRDLTVTGVQTCALPIWPLAGTPHCRPAAGTTAQSRSALPLASARAITCCACCDACACTRA